jgi:hypothetical protein
MEVEVEVDVTLRRVGLVVGLAAAVAAAAWLLRLPANRMPSSPNPADRPIASAERPRPVQSLDTTPRPARDRASASQPAEQMDRPAPAPGRSLSEARPAESPAGVPPSGPPVAPPAPNPPLPAPDPIHAPATTLPPAAAPLAKGGLLTLVVPRDAVIGIRLDGALTSERAQVEDKVTAVVARDVVVDGVTAIPAGTRVEGTVILIERPSNGRAKIGVRFTALVRAEDSRLPIQTEPIYRESDPIGPAPASFAASSGFGAVMTNRGGPPVRGAMAPSPAPTGPIRYQPLVRIPAGAAMTVLLTAPVSLTVVRSPVSP